MTVMPCQCGAKNEPDVARVRYTAEQGAWQVRCLRCKASSSARDSQADAVNAWNRLALAVQITEAAWLEDAAMEAVDEAMADWRDSGDEFDALDCARLEKRRLLDAWGEDPDA